MAFECDGMDEMISKLTRMGKDVDTIKEKAIKAGAKVIRDEMESKCARRSSGTRHIKDNIIVTEIMKGVDGEPYALVGPHKKFFYGKYLEYGTVHQSPQPFAENSFLEKKEEALNKMAEIVGGELGV